MSRMKLFKRSFDAYSRYFVISPFLSRWLVNLNSSRERFFNLSSRSKSRGIKLGQVINFFQRPSRDYMIATSTRLSLFSFRSTLQICFNAIVGSTMLAKWSLVKLLLVINLVLRTVLMTLSIVSVTHKGDFQSTTSPQERFRSLAFS